MNVEYLTFDKACERVGISRNTLTKWIATGLPVIVFSERLKRIRADHLDRWIAANFEVTATSQDRSATHIYPGQLIEIIRKGTR